MTRIRGDAESRRRPRTSSPLDTAASAAESEAAAVTAASTTAAVTGGRITDLAGTGPRRRRGRRSDGLPSGRMPGRQARLTDQAGTGRWSMPFFELLQAGCAAGPGPEGFVTRMHVQ